MADPLPDEIQEIIVRFASAIPDLRLILDAPRTTTALTVKTLIRRHLPANLSSNRLNLIYAGKLLPNIDPLYSSLRLSRQPPPPIIQSADKPPGRGYGPGPPPIYIHCSIGDRVSSTELKAEADAASAAESQLRDAQHARFPPAQQPGPNDDPRTSTAPQPRGLDRLLATGFTAQDIATLRASFLAQLAHTHTPDRMPQGDALRALEDRWLDSTGGDEGGIQHLDDDEGAALDDFLWGSIMGFFWPVGALWGYMEDGIWTQRRQMAVYAGLMMNLAFGFFRLVGR
jgi:DUF2407 C-terminal domain/DUF2407 ubiquitin-like domain